VDTSPPQISSSTSPISDSAHAQSSAPSLMLLSIICTMKS
jgi:hypothetical protein